MLSMGNPQNLGSCDKAIVYEQGTKGIASGRFPHAKCTMLKDLKLSHIGQAVTQNSALLIPHMRWEHSKIGHIRRGITECSDLASSESFYANLRVSDYSAQDEQDGTESENLYK